MKTEKDIDTNRRVIAFLTIISAVTGLIIFFIFLYFISEEYHIYSEGSLDMDATGQVGDFLGGVVGSIWSITAILLFYLALVLNRKEFVLQRKQLELQRVEISKQNLEFQLNRITNIGYKQIEICNLKINQFQVKDEQITLQGRVAIKYSIDKLLDFQRHYTTNIFSGKEEVKKLNQKSNTYKFVLFNKQEIINLTDTIYNSCLLMQLLIAVELDIKDNSKKDQLKLLFLGNLGKDVDTFYSYLYKLFNNTENKSSSLYKQVKLIYLYQKYSYKNAISMKMTAEQNIQLGHTSYTVVRQVY